MDKYEYKLRADEIRALIKEKKYREAVEIADTIDWRNVRNGGTLCSISDLYKICKRYSDSREVLLLAYQRNPGGRAILYSLCELSIKLNDIMAAMEYYKEYSAVAPKDPGRFILNYKIYTAMEASLEERIAILEELKLYECKEKWMYELAYLYHMQGVSEKCVEECNQIVLFFGDGKYVLKALELKSLHEPLSAEQDILYRRLTEPKENDVLVKDMDVSKFNTIDLQKELANGVAEVLFDDTKNLPDLSHVLKEEKPEESDNADTAVIIEENPEEKEEATEDISGENIDSDVTPAISIIDLQKNSGEDYEVTEEDTKEDAEHTKVLDTKAIERAMGNADSEERDVSAGPGEEKEAATSRTVMPQRSLDDMHEVMPKSSTNSAIVFPNYDDMVSMEGDGQISFNVPDQEMVEKQITGQISIAEVLLEWERMKNANEKKWREDMRRKVIAQTKVLFREFDEDAKEGLLEKLEEEVTESDTVELTGEEQRKLMEEDLPQVVIEEMPEEESNEEEVLEDSEKNDSEELKEAVEEESTEETAEETSEESEEDNTPVTEKSDSQGDIKEIILEDEDKEEEAESESTEEELTEGERLERILEKELEEKELDEKEESEEDSEETTFEEPTPEELSFDRTQFIDTTAENQDDISAKEPEASDNTEVLPQVGANLDYLIAFAEAGAERDIKDLAAVGVAVVDSIAENEEVVETSEDEEESVEAVVEEDTEVQEEESVTEEEASEEDNNPEEAEAEEAESTEEVEEEAEGEQVSEPEIRSSGFTLDQERRFEAFIQTETAREQLLEALSLISMDANHGNVIIGSDDTDSSVELAKAIMMELSDREGIAGKVAKIKASTLNAKDAEETLTKLYEGALIIQDAHELRPETLMSLQKVLASENEKFFVILTCLKRLKNRFIAENRDLLTAFDISIDVEALTNRELVAYAKSYAYNKECTIDEMGTLALHRRIEEKQTNEHAVTIIEVKAIVDAAIAKASKKNFKHFVDVLFNKKYDENDLTVLKEKDFLEKNKE